jgi:hypothetical protein
MRPPTFIITLALVVGVCGRGNGQSHAAKGDAMGISIHNPNELKWSDAPPSLPRGAKIAVLEGDPSKEGPFVFRALLPDGYRIPPHTHPKVERITVISGTFNVGMGDKFDPSKTRAMPAGTYGSWPAGMKHFVWAKGETVIQFHGTGPWSLTYVNPDDDPRKTKKDDLKSGPQAGENLPGPFYPLIVVDAEDPRLAGSRSDYYERFGNDPAVLIFAREVTEPLTDLVQRLGSEVAKHKPAKLRLIVVILSDDEALEERLKNLGKNQGIKNAHLALMEPDGPKHYKLSKEADVTVVMYKRRKVEANHAFAKGKLNEAGVASILADLPKLVPNK